MRIYIVLTLLLASAYLINADVISETPALKVGDDWECTTCKILAEVLDTLLEMNVTETWIIDELDYICEWLGPMFETTCEVYVEVGVEVVIDWLEANETPDVRIISEDQPFLIIYQVICAQLSMCNETIAVPEPMPEAEILCRECEVMVYLIDAWLDDEDNIEELDGYIEELCGYLGEPWQKVCDQVLETGVANIAEWLIRHETPFTVCTQQLKVCNAGFQ